jgi:DNA mismatch repair protein MutS2
MNDQAFTTLEYGALLSLVERHAQTPMGRARARDLSPSDRRQDLQLSLASVSESVGLRQRGIATSFSGIDDPQDTLARLRVEHAVLDPLSILQLARLCEQALAARSVLHSERDNCPALWGIVSSLPKELHTLVVRITNKILPGGEIDDRASPELARVRHEISKLRSRITRSLETLMRKEGEAIQDPLVTIRNDRYVIPVKVDHRARVQGVAHGFSSSGATVFIEPMDTIDANNELQSLKETEEREIARVLLELTENLRQELPAVHSAAHAVEELDFVNAKTGFHESFECVIPEIGAAGTSDTLELREARHPLLAENLRQSGGEVVPVSFTLDASRTAMIISGANAGGKTVVLKTAGLLSLMALSGLPVPARVARVPFYRSVLADIGDHQSLAANLSTFTSHVANISRMIEMCEAPALVLLDEVGTGTDPEEGSALGVAVVGHFRRTCGAHVMATTHYSGLKMYAANEENVLNASVEFDERTLKPTYRLIVGVAGSSSGLEIARRFGIPDQIIHSANELVSDSSREAYDYLKRIKTEAEEVTALRAALEEERTAVAEKFSSLDRQAERREGERKSSFDKTLRQTIDEFERRAREIVSHIQDRAERIKLERETQKRAAELRREAERAKQSLSSRSAESASRPVRVVRDGQLRDPESDTVREVQELDESHRYETVAADRAIKVGDRVRLRSFGSIGIVDKLKDDEAEVRVKSLRLREKLANLELVEEVTPAKDTGGKFASLRRTSSAEVRLRSSDERATSELNVIGRTTDEAVDAVDKFLDEASLASLSEVRIVHGHGTGALRRAIGELLQGHPHVARFAPAAPNQGGSGATVVELRT